MAENILRFNIPNTITVGVMALVMGSLIAIGTKGYQALKAK